MPLSGACPAAGGQAQTTTVAARANEGTNARCTTAVQHFNLAVTGITWHVPQYEHRSHMFHSYAGAHSPIIRQADVGAVARFVPCHGRHALNVCTRRILSALFPGQVSKLAYTKSSSLHSCQQNMERAPTDVDVNKALVSQGPGRIHTAASRAAGLISG